MKKLLAALGAAVMLLSLFGAASATAAPGPNGTNDKGLCTAFFNGQKAGHDRDGDGRTDNARAFQGLEEAAGVLLETLPEDVADLVYQFCLTVAGRDTDGDGEGDGVEIGGNFNDNGRWTCSVDDGGNDDPLDDTYTCDPNEPKGNGTGPGSAPA